MTRTIQTTITLVFASIVFVAMTQSAFADWLIGGAEIKETVTTTSEEEIQLEDTKTAAGKVAVLCKVIFDGNVSPEEKDETTEILNTAKEKIGELGGLALLCTSVSTCAAATEASPIEVWPVGLPWLSKLQEVEEKAVILDKITGNTGEAGWEILCLILGINAEDTCTGTETAELSGTEATGLLSLINAESGKETCSQSHEASGIETGEGAVTRTNGEHIGALLCYRAAAAEYENLFFCLAGLNKGLYTNGRNDVLFGG